jgi:hypothetical protein
MVIFNWENSEPGHSWDLDDAMTSIATLPSHNTFFSAVAGGGGNSWETMLSKVGICFAW